MAEQTIGFIGAGRMGSAMIGRLLDAGRSVKVWNRTAAKAAPLAARGAVIVDAIADLGSCPIVISCVSSSPDLLAVLLGPDGLLGASALPSVVVDCSTVSAEASAQVREACAERGVAYLASPVSGNARVVAAGECCLVVSGDHGVFDETKAVLDDISGTTVWVGPAEQSRLVKLAMNVFLGVTVQSLVEVITLVEKGGTSREDFLDVLNSTMVTTEWIRRRTPELLSLDWTPTFTMELIRKDFDLGLTAARDLEVPMPTSAVVHHLIQAAIGMGWRETDFVSLYSAQAAVAGLDPQPID